MAVVETRRGAATRRKRSDERKKGGASKLRFQPHSYTFDPPLSLSLSNRIYSIPRVYRFLTNFHPLFDRTCG